MKKLLVWATAILLLLALAVALGLFRWMGRGVSARDTPSAIEVWVAGQMRQLATPRSAREARNPFRPTEDVLTDARRHFADHCAICHANDGSGRTDLGRNLYPKPPDLRLPATQQLTDGELYYVIHNGVRLTGMPAWGVPGQSERDDDHWALVLFIRHLPQLTPTEEQDMERYNPISEAERQPEAEGSQTPSGGEATPAPHMAPHEHGAGSGK